MNRFTATGCLLLAVSASVFADEPGDQPSTSKDLGYGTYQDRAGRVELVVGAHAAAISQHEPYIPLQILLAVWEKGPELAVTMARFSLIDSTGEIYEPSTTQEMAKQASLLQFMEEYRKTSPLQVGNEFTNLRRIASNFYPLNAGNFYVEEHLDLGTYLQDVIYFPTPKAGIAGVMTLQFLTPGMDQPVEVRFEAPVKQNRHGKTTSKTTKKKKKN